MIVSLTINNHNDKKGEKRENMSKFEITYTEKKHNGKVKSFE